jgi:hypothetical protein
MKLIKSITLALFLAGSACAAPQDNIAPLADATPKTQFIRWCAQHPYALTLGATATVCLLTYLFWPRPAQQPNLTLITVASQETQPEAYQIPDNQRRALISTFAADGEKANIHLIKARFAGAFSDTKFARLFKAFEDTKAGSGKTEKAGEIVTYLKSLAPAQG